MALSAALHGAARGDAAPQTRSALTLALQPILDDNTAAIVSLATVRAKVVHEACTMWTAITALGPVWSFRSWSVILALHMALL